MARIEQAFSIGMEELHGEVNALQIPALDRQVTGVGSSTTEHHRVELLAEFGCGHMDAYGGSAEDTRPLFGPPGAGQTRPVNSGKLLVLCRRSSASFHRPR